MSKNANSCRNFIKTVALSSVSAIILPIPLAASEYDMFEDTFKKDKGLIFLFQGDSIADGNRGRNSDPNHFMRMVMPFTSQAGLDVIS